MSVFGAPGQGIHVTPLVGADGQLTGIHIGPSSAELIAQGEAARAAARNARVMRDENITKSRQLWRETQAARASEAAHAVKDGFVHAGKSVTDAAVRAQQAPRMAACRSLPADRIEEALQQRKALDAKAASHKNWWRHNGASHDADNKFESAEVQAAAAADSIRSA
jgi:hypothetical protein